MGTKIQDSHKEYHSKPNYIGASGLKTIYTKSLLHYKDELEKPHKLTDSQIIGSSFHYYMENEETFYKKVKVVNKELDKPEDKAMNSKLNREWWNNLKENNEIIISPEVMANNKKMKELLYQNDFIRSVIMDGKAELSHYIEFEGVNAKLRCDNCREFDNFVVVLDWKTTMSATIKDFSSSCANHFYPIQYSWYVDVLEHFYQKPVEMYYVAIEKEPPFDYILVNGKHELGEEFYDAGKILYNRALDKYKEAVKTGIWEGNKDKNKYGIVCPKLPNWFFYNNGLEHLII